ncbi:Na+/H+ antiporter NhaC family protein [Sutterella sp.]|uniref:Na+/H+ antiporter NhaC family protein n=1 Tax=Sutterella sp. TaxID=1981025 RepID=UPI0026DFBDC2|nr:Na+/H+ antiporter NhaC family protein [Sutterella sp.]MDO5532027.1 Na+/H+ antiporter NhaC family protein [Sutterella sp.]
MEPYAAGWLSIVPPIVAIALALVTKEVLSSLLIGILTGTLIYTIGTDGNIIMGTVQTTFTLMANKIDFSILIFTSLLGALVYVVAMSGGTKAYGNWAVKRVKSRRATLLSTMGLGILIFIDDYFNCLSVGTVMRPLSDRYGISRAKLAYIIDSTAAPVCIIAPVSSWAAAVGSSLKGNGVFESDMAAFIASIPWNFYALLSIFMVFFIIITDLDFGPMRKSEERAAAGNIGAVEGGGGAEPPKANPNGHVMDMIIPILALIIFAVLALMYSGGYWGDDPAYHSFQASIGNSSAAAALVWAAFGSVGVAFLLYVPRKLVPFMDFMSGLLEGMKLMLPANVILVLAWALSGVCRDLISTPQFVEGLVTGAGTSLSLFLPCVVFIIAAFLAFSTGTAWGTFGILIPIVVPVVQGIDPSLTIVVLSATLAGSVFGDHCSPISDTTILSSAGGGCNHMEHVTTQLPYALLVAVCSALGYLVAGFSGGNLWLSFGVALAALILSVIALHSMKGREKKAAAA